MHDEHVITLDCFGARCTIALTNGAGAPLRAIAAASFLLECHRRLSRFLPQSELSRLNADPRETVPVSPLMADFLGAARRAGEASDGLVDATLLPALRDAGYSASLPDRDPGLLAPANAAGAPAGADPASRWRGIDVDAGAGTVTRPPGLEIDSGGVAKGWAADRAAAILGDAPTLAVECAGDIRISGSAGAERRIAVTDPFDGSTIAELRLSDGGVATSGTGKRRWRNADGTVGHHLIDPATGRPCESGVVQATAIAPTAELAEVRAKSAVLSGPDRAAERLPDGGWIVLADRTVAEVPSRDRRDAHEAVAA
ncbi:MAG: FAD:protein FMN transferase [Solirubrobacterales bacterium]